MARIRTIKPEIWKHPVICRLPDDFQLLALSLISMADDEGYFRADPSIVRGEVMPFRESLARIREGLDRLSEVAWIELANNPEQGLIGHITNWAKHQKVDHPSPSKIKVYFVRDTLANPSRSPLDSLALDQGSGIKDQGSGNREGNSRKSRVEDSRQNQPPFSKQIEDQKQNEKGITHGSEDFIRTTGSDRPALGSVAVKSDLAAREVNHDRDSDVRGSGDGRSVPGSGGTDGDCTSNGTPNDMSWVQYGVKVREDGADWAWSRGMDEFLGGCVKHVSEKFKLKPGEACDWLIARAKYDRAQYEKGHGVEVDNFYFRHARYFGERNADKPKGRGLTADKIIEQQRAAGDAVPILDLNAR